MKPLFQAGQAVLTVHAMSATRPWPQGAPGRPVSEELLRSFAGDKKVIMTSAHCVLPVRSPA